MFSYQRSETSIGSNTVSPQNIVGQGTTLVQVARTAGIHVIGTAEPRHHDALRAWGVEPIDYSDPALCQWVRDLAPGGVAAVSDHLGGDSFRRPFDLLADGGTLVAYGTMSRRDHTSSIALACLLSLVRTVATATTRGDVRCGRRGPPG